MKYFRGLLGFVLAITVFVVIPVGMPCLILSHFFPMWWRFGDYWVVYGAVTVMGIPIFWGMKSIHDRVVIAMEGDPESEWKATKKLLDMGLLKFDKEDPRKVCCTEEGRAVLKNLPALMSQFGWKPQNDVQRKLLSVYQKEFVK